MSISVLQAGPLTTIQDWGRFTHQQIGCSVSGPMDEHAFLWAQKLLDNNVNSPLFEIAIGNVEFEFQEATQVAISGASGVIQLNQQNIDPWRSFQVQAGDRLRLHFFDKGMYAYLAVRGGLQVQQQLNSASSSVREGIGYRPLKEGDVINYNKHDSQRQSLVPHRFRPDYGDDISIAVQLAYQAADFAAAERERFFNAAYEIQGASNRMGLRLQGPAVQVPDKTYRSEGIAYGAIQIPPNGQPIIMAKERQNIGGYPKIGCVSVMDMSRLAQARPGSRVHFYEADLAKATQSLKQRNQFFNKQLVGS